MAEAGQSDELLALVDQADAMFLPSGDDHDAARFYHEIARLADGPALSGVRDDLRDRARVGLAAKLRQNIQGHARAGSAGVSALLGGRSTWTPSAVRDAEHALKTAPRRAVEDRPEPSRDALRIPGTGHVTAACAASEADEIFLGFEGGEVYCFRPRTAEVAFVAADDLPVASLSTRPDGQSLVVLRAVEGAAHGTLSTYVRKANGAYRAGLGAALNGFASPWLMPVLCTARGDFVGVCDGVEVSVLEVGTLAVRVQATMGFEPDEVSAALLLPTGCEAEHPILLNASGRWGWFDPGRGVHTSVSAGGIAAVVPGGSSLRHAHVAQSWTGPDSLEVAWIGEYGTLCWSRFRIDGAAVALAASGTSGQTGGYRTAVIVPAWPRHEHGPDADQPLSRGNLVDAVSLDLTQIRRDRRGFCLPPDRRADRHHPGGMAPTRKRAAYGPLAVHRTVRPSPGEPFRPRVSAGNLEENTVHHVPSWG